MKQILLYLSILFLLVSCDSVNDDDDTTPPVNTTPPVVTQQWEQAPVFPGVERQNASSFVIADKFYVGLGTGMKDGRIQSLNDFYEYNPTSRAWRQIAEFPGISREHAIGFTVNSKGYIGIGQKFLCPITSGLCDQTDLKDFWEYDPKNNSWKEVAKFDMLPNDGRGGSVFTLNNKAYILHNNFIWEFNPADYSLTKKAMSPEFLPYASAFTLNGKGYIGTGSTDVSKSLYEYDPATDKWTKKADFGGLARRSAVGFSMKGKGYIGFGEGKEQISPGTFRGIGFNDMWEYDPQTDTWKKFTEHPNLKLLRPVGGAVQDRFIVGLGRTENNPFPIKAFWLF